MTKTDLIERTIAVSRPIERVWDAITQAEQLARRFGDSAEIDLRPGGAIKLGWSEHDATIAGVVGDVDPPRRFSFSWEAHTAADGSTRSTNVVFHLDESDGQTTVTVSETGFSELPDDIYEQRLRDNTEGWAHELDELRHILEEASVA